VQFYRKKDEAGIRRPPEDRFAIGVPGKDPFPIRREKAFRRKVAAHGQKAAFLGVVDRGKPNRVRESIDRHG
jgi:hypothetical protein